MGFSRQEHWSGLPCSPAGDLPNSGTEPVSLISPALAGRFFTTNSTWGSVIWFQADSHLLRPTSLHTEGIAHRDLSWNLPNISHPERTVLDFQPRQLIAPSSDDHETSSKGIGWSRLQGPRFVQQAPLLLLCGCVDLASDDLGVSLIQTEDFPTWNVGCFN